MIRSPQSYKRHPLRNILATRLILHHRRPKSFKIVALYDSIDPNLLPKVIKEQPVHLVNPFKCILWTRWFEINRHRLAAGSGTDRDTVACTLDQCPPPPLGNIYRGRGMFRAEATSTGTWSHLHIAYNRAKTLLLLLYACVQEIYRKPSAIPVNVEVEVTWWSRSESGSGSWSSLPAFHSNP